MKLFGKEVGKAITFPPFIERFKDKLLSTLGIVDEELVTIPSTNISDEETAFELAVAVPGLDKKDVRIELHGNTLIISGEKEQSQEVKDKSWLRLEFVRSSFYRAFDLPTNTDPERISARIKNGLLEVRIAKRETETKHKRKLKVA